MRYQAGLSLLELLVVIAIIGIVSGFAAPRMSEWNCKRELRKDFDVLTSIYTQARAEALSRKISVGVRPISKGGNSYFQVGQTNKLCSSSFTSVIDETLVPQGLTGMSGALCFHADGSASGIKHFMSGQCGAKTHRYQIQISTLTGYVIREYLPPGGSQWLEI